MITLRQLRYLECLSQTLHFGKAADACAVTQPALSMQIRDLEEILGVSLVERRKAGVEMTEEGWEVARRARTILASVRDLVDYAKMHDEMLSGTLRLGAIPSIAPYMLPKALPIVQKEYPNLKLQLRETLTDILLRDLLAGELDVVLAALPMHHPDIEAVHLFDDSFLLAVNQKQNKDATRATPEQLVDERLLLLEEGHCLRDQALAFCQMVSPEARASFGASSLATIVQMVGSGFGVTLLPEMAASIELSRRQDIKLLRFEEPQPKRQIGLAWRKTSPRKPDYERFGELLTEVGLKKPDVAAA